MSRNIIEKGTAGSLNVRNGEEGAEFGIGVAEEGQGCFEGLDAASKVIGVEVHGTS